MKDLGVKSPLAAMSDLITSSLGDCARAMRHRALLGLSLVVLTAVIEKILAMHGVPYLRAGWAQVAAFWALSFLFFADAMRTIDPSYRVTSERLWRLVGIAIQAHFLMGVALLIPGVVAFLIFKHDLSAIYLSLTPFIIFMQARFCFVWFVSERDADSVATSWSLTARPTLAASLVPSVIAWAPLFLVSLLSSHLTQHFGWYTPAPQYATLETVAAFVDYAWVYPLTARWFVFCTRAHPETELGIAYA